MQNKSNFSILGSFILLVVPSPDDYSALNSFILEHGADYVWATTKAEALEKINQCDPDIIVMNNSLDEKNDGEDFLVDLLFIKQNKSQGILLVDKLPDLSTIMSKNYLFLEKSSRVEDLFLAISKIVQKKLLETAFSFKAFEVNPMQLKCRVLNINVDADMIEADQSFIRLNLSEMVSLDSYCEIEITNFLNEKGPTYKINGQVSSVEEYDKGSFLVEVTIDDNCILTWRKLFSRLVSRQNESLDFVKTVQG
jgi:hypothetical protein